MAWSRRNASALRPDALPRAWKRVVQALLEEDWVTAETWLERIVEADRHDVEAYRALAGLYRRNGSVGRAIRMHQNLLLRTNLPKRDRQAALLGLAGDLEAGGFMDRAAAAYQEFLETEPRHPEAIRRLVPLLQDQREHARVLALLKKLRRHDAAEADRLERTALLAEARACAEAGNQTGARQALKRAIKRDAACGEAHALLGDLEAERGRDSAAIQAWKRAVEADASVGAAVYPQIDAGLAARGKRGDFEKFLRGLLERRPDDTQARIALARALLRAGEGRAAIEELARAIERAPTDLRLRAELGRQLLAAQQDAESLKAYADLVAALEHREDLAMATTALMASEGPEA